MKYIFRDLLWNSEGGVSQAQQTEKSIQMKAAF